MNGITDGPETIPEESPLIINGRQICLTLIRVPDEKEHSFIAVLKDYFSLRNARKILSAERNLFLQIGYPGEEIIIYYL